jgi:hypothetical protein
MVTSILEARLDNLISSKHKSIKIHIPKN